MYETYTVTFLRRQIVIFYGYERARLAFPDDPAIERCLDVALDWIGARGRRVVSVLQLIHPGDFGPPREEFGWQFRVVTEPLAKTEERLMARPHPGSRVS